MQFIKSLSRVLRYTLTRGITIFLTVVVGVYLTIIVANLGGYVDEIFRGQISLQIAGMVQGGWLSDVPVEEREAIIEETVWQMEEARGLHRPFLLRTASWLVNGLTLNLGEASLRYFFEGIFVEPEQAVQSLVLDRLPYTLLLIGTANVLVFIASVSLALVLSRTYGGIADRVMVAFASFTSAPSWIFGVILIVVVAGRLQFLPFPKAIEIQHAEYNAEFFKLLGTQMIMPVMAIFLSLFFLGTYTWRTFFLMYSREDYVEMGKAKGVSPRMLERNYILRPSLPFVITSFALMVVTVWESAIVLELIFYWPGIGPLFFNGIENFNTPIVVAVVVIFAYLLALTVFLLDIVYAIVDPRVRIGSSGHSLRPARRKRRLLLPWKARQNPRISRPVSSAVSGNRSTATAVQKPTFQQRLNALGKRITSLKNPLKEIIRYPSALLGLVIIIALIALSVYTLFALPYDQAISLWQAHSNEGGRSVWYRNSRNALPSWVNIFRRDNLPETIALNTMDGSAGKQSEVAGQDMTRVTATFNFDYDSEIFPEDLILYLESEFEEKAPHVTLTWITPDGMESELTSFSPEHNETFYLTQDERVMRKFGDLSVIQGMFGDPEKDMTAALKGPYQLRVDGFIFEEGGDIETEVVLYGLVSGLAGTDHLRRDLTVALMWGAPIALAFGLIGAVVTSLLAMLIAAVGVWYGGWLDELIQRITEVNMILPTLAIAIMVFLMYSKSIWAVLGVVILLSIFGNSLKSYRAAFIQMKEAGYVEAALAYGASNWRIITRYLIPRILPVMIPQLVILVPGFVFMEATLAYLGVSDPVLPTWGKLIYESIENGALQGSYYWVLEPIGLLVLTGLAFALLGYALDRIVNPRLQER